MAMVEIDNHPTNMHEPDDRDTKPRRLTKKMIFFLALTLIAAAVIVILALIGPVVGGDISIVLSL
jgi:hypothetical protein